MKQLVVRIFGHSGLGVIQSCILGGSLGHLFPGTGSGRGSGMKGADPPEVAVHAHACTSAMDLDIP